MWVCITYVTVPLLTIYSYMIEEIKRFSPSSYLLSAIEQMYFMFCLFRTLRCANTTEYYPGWVTFVQWIYSLSVVMMARHTAILAGSVMKICKYTSPMSPSSSVEALDDSADPQQCTDMNVRCVANNLLIVAVKIQMLWMILFMHKIERI